MKAEDRGYFNCDASRFHRVPIVKDSIVSDLVYWGIYSCRQKLSEHFKHYIEPAHVCAWHSDILQHDDRYSSWKETIDL